VYFSFLLVIPAYFIGMIPFSVIVARIAGYDLYSTGSQNPGASNVARVAGWKWGSLAMALDIAKGFVPTLLTLVLLDGHISDQTVRIAGYLVAAAAMIGHVLPIGRKGGKGIATGGGAAVALFPLPGIAVIIVWIIMMKITKLPVVASLIAAGLLPIWVGFDHKYFWEFTITVLLYAVVVIRHIPNIKRLILRQESSVTKHGRGQYQSVEEPKART
jgi:glycerol-3-phosphate acyltransferase PlsY